MPSEADAVADADRYGHLDRDERVVATLRRTPS
jgi:hypothetical protein